MVYVGHDNPAVGLYDQGQYIDIGEVVNMVGVHAHKDVDSRRIFRRYIDAFVVYICYTKTATKHPSSSC